MDRQQCLCFHFIFWTHFFQYFTFCVIKQSQTPPWHSVLIYFQRRMAALSFKSFFLLLRARASVPHWSASLFVRRGSKERVPWEWEHFLFAETWWFWRLQRRSRSYYSQFIREKRRKVIAECNLCATPKAPQWEITQEIHTNWRLWLLIVPSANSCCFLNLFIAFEFSGDLVSKAERPQLDVKTTINDL